MKQMFRGFAFLAGFVVMAAAVAKGADPGPQTVAIFPAEMKHNHSSCVVELADGDLLACWYRGSGERKADDVAIWARGATRRRASGAPGFRWLIRPAIPTATPPFSSTRPAASGCFTRRSSTTTGRALS